jgi:sugar lactone lactonase YvrE
MKTTFRFSFRFVHHSLRGAVCAWVCLLFAFNAPAQNLFVANESDNTVSQFTPAGAQTTFASGLTTPTGLAFDTAGNLFVEDAGSGNIYKYTPDGTQSIFFSGVGGGQLAFNSSGDLFESAEGSGDIHEYTPDGTQSTFVSGVTSGDGLAFNTAGNLFVISGNGSIYEYTPTGSQSTFAPPVSTIPFALAFNSVGDLFESDTINGNIYEYTPDGTQSTFASGLSFPLAMAINSADNVFVADASGNIYEYTPDGTRSTFASGLSSGATQMAFEPAPEPSVLELLAVTGAAFLIGNRKYLYRLYAACCCIVSA